jgi:hypothetical protein
MNDQDDAGQEAIRQAQYSVENQQALAAQNLGATLFQQQVDTLVHTLQVGDWSVFQEYHHEQQQNAREAALDDERQQAQSRHVQEG